MTAGRAFAAAVIVSFLLASTPGAAAPQPSTKRTNGEVLARGADGSFVHRASGFVFPSRLDRLTVVREKVYAQDNVAVRYGSGDDSGRPWVDLQIYPADGTIEQEAEAAGQTIVDRYGATPLPDMRTLPATAADGRTRWFAARLGKVGITTGYVLVRRGGWSIKAQATSPATAGVPGVEQLFDAIAAVRWSWTPAPAESGSARIVAR